MKTSIITFLCILKLGTCLSQRILGTEIYFANEKSNKNKYGFNSVKTNSVGIILRTFYAEKNKYNFVNLFVSNDLIINDSGNLNVFDLQYLGLSAIKGRFLTLEDSKKSSNIKVGVGFGAFFRSALNGSNFIFNNNNWNKISEASFADNSQFGFAFDIPLLLQLKPKLSVSLCYKLNMNVLSFGTNKLDLKNRGYNNNGLSIGFQYKL
jgi:hypothetical protein